jgi:hypothetical protein
MWPKESTSLVSVGTSELSWAMVPISIEVAVITSNSCTSVAAAVPDTNYISAVVSTTTVD